MASPTPQIRGVHHTAFRCRDAEETRHFYEDVLGLPLAAALSFEKDPGGNDRPYMHLFFEMGDGNYVAFFDLPHTVEEKRFRIRDGMEEYHLAMEVGSREELLAFQERLLEHDVPVYGPIDHHFCHSIYFYDPNGLALELTHRDGMHDEIMAAEAASAGKVIEEWRERTADVRTGRLEGTAESRAKKDALVRKMVEVVSEQIATAGRVSS